MFLRGFLFKSKLSIFVLLFKLIFVRLLLDKLTDFKVSDNVILDILLLDKFKVSTPDGTVILLRRLKLAFISFTLLGITRFVSLFLIK